jgi:beta-lactamase class A
MAQLLVTYWCGRRRPADFGPGNISLTRKTFLALSLAAMLAPALSSAQAPVRYDVAYLWHASRTAANRRMKSVGAVLGPRAAQKLRVVWVDGGCAVVYPREGAAAEVRATARLHKKLLRRRAPGPAFAVLSRQWKALVPAGSSLAVAAAPRPRAQPARPAPQAKPVHVARGPQPDFEEHASAAARSANAQLFETLIDDHIKLLRRQGRLARDERTAWSVYDFTTGEMLVEINPDIELQSASLVKPFLALAFMHEAAAGRLVYDDQSRVQMERMIQLSDNASADWVMRKVGGPAAVERILRADYGALLQGVEIKEYIPRDGRTYRNRASARDYSRFLLALWRDELPNSEEIKRLMGLPKRDRLRTGVPLPQDTQVFSKTGSTSRLCGDIGVLLAKGADGKQYPYTLIGIIEKQNRARHYFGWLRSRGNVIREISAMVYARLGALHGFTAMR